MKKYILPFAGALLMLCYYSCTKDKTSQPMPPDCSGIDPHYNTYTNHMATILNSSCAYVPCHDAATVQGGINLATYSSAVNAFTYRNVICAVKQQGCEPMPQNSRPLADSLINFMECWQANGFPQ